VPIRWDDLPHEEIRWKIYTRLRHNAVERATRDSLRHILVRRLHELNAADHRRFVEIEACSLVEHLRCTRDVYREICAQHGCQPILEAHWVVLRVAVYPTAIALLRERLLEYARLTRIPGRDLSLLFGIETQTCYVDCGHGMAMMRAPDPENRTPASQAELECLVLLIQEDTFLDFRDIRSGGGVWVPCGGGPFALDDGLSMRRSFSLCGLRYEMTFPEWNDLRKKWWRTCAPWSEGLSSLYASVLEELLTQWRALPLDSKADEIALAEATSGLTKVVVPAEPNLPLRLQRGKECEELAEEMNVIEHRCRRGGRALREIQAEVSDFRIWKCADALTSEDKETFYHPGTWGPGYANLLLGKVYARAGRNISGETINTWRKDYRAYVRWQKDNPLKTPDDFVRGLRAVRRGYRTSSMKG